MRHRSYRPSILPGWVHLFFGVLVRQPARAMGAAYWYATRRRVRASNRLWAAAANLPEAYKIWVGAVEQREVAHLRLAERDRVGGSTFSVLVDATSLSNIAVLEDTLDSVRAQIDWAEDLIVIGPPALSRAARANETYLTLAGSNPDPAAAWRAALAAARGDFVVFLPADAVLPPWAVARYREAARRDADATVFYGDEDLIDDAGRRSRPWFKPRWNGELILALDYVSHACAVATPLARVAADTAGDLADNAGYALLLAASAQPDVKISHISHVLCHMREKSTQPDVATDLKVVARHVAPMGATVERGPFGTRRIHWPLPEPAPSVTIIIPTRDRVDLLEACVGSLLRETDYADYDVLIVDNGSVDPQTIAWFEAITAQDRVSVLRYDRPYNYSALNNFAAARARGQYLCLLNNDTEVVERPWLSALMRYAVRPGIGAVGAKLLYADGSIQHAGVVMGLGNAAGHAHRALPDDQPGYFGVAHAAHYASAVTAACLVVERSKFAAVGGLDETHLQIAYNDVDLCLKLERAGWRNVYAPQAVLIHHESKSRGLDMSPQHVERYRRELAVLQERWGTVKVVDPMHHPRLDRSSETYRILIEGPA